MRPPPYPGTNFHQGVTMGHLIFPEFRISWLASPRRRGQIRAESPFTEEALELD